nr:tetraspanin [Hymenolepis microstoma]
MPRKKNSTGCFRFLLVIFDFAVFASGALLLGYGSILLHVERTRGLMERAPVLEAFMILIGSFLLVTAITGCIGAFKGNRTVNLVFTAAMLILILSEIIIGAMMIRSSKEAVERVESDLVKIISEYEKGIRSAEQISTLKRFQTHFHCCGAKSPADYEFPYKVCCDVGSICVTYPSEGCVSAYRKALVDYRQPVGIAVIVLAIIEIGAAVCSMMIGAGPSIIKKIKSL